MSHTTNSMAHVAITTLTERGTLTTHWTTTYVDARGIVARYVTRNGLRRDAYSDAEKLYRGDAAVGSYQITRHS